MNLILPDFEALKPHKLEQLSRRIEMGSYQFREIEYDFFLLVEKLKKGTPLLNTELLSLLSEQIQLIELGLLNRFFEVFKGNLERTSRMKKEAMIKRIVHYMLISYYHKPIWHQSYKLVKTYHKNIIQHPLQTYLAPSWSITKKTMLQVIDPTLPDPKISFEALEMFEDLKTELMIAHMVNPKTKDELVDLIMAGLSYSNQGAVALIDFFLCGIPEEKLIKINNSEKQFFQFIHNRHTTPKQNHAFWRQVSDEGRFIFNRFLVLNELWEYFFGLEVRREDRLEFWLQYFHYFRSVRFYRDLDQALIIETDRHTIVEFNGPKGGSLYFYSREMFNLEIFAMKRDSVRNQSYLISNVLKNKSQVLFEPLKHNSGWQNRFSNTLHRLQYYRK